jgi:hypothetical protein
MNTELLTLFDLLPDSPPAPDVEPCMWHLKEAPQATHRVVKAADLLDPTWWRWGSLPDGAIAGGNGHPMQLYVVGAGYCDACIARDAGAWLTPGTVRHFIPIAGGAS